MRNLGQPSDAALSAAEIQLLLAAAVPADARGRAWQQRVRDWVHSGLVATAVVVALVDVLLLVGGTGA